MALFLRIFQHLLPNATAWRLTIQKALRRFFEGLTGLPTDVRQFVDNVYLDLFPATTRELAEWERQFALNPGASNDATRRQALAAAWQAQGGQSPRYLQDTVQAAGFPVYIHEWWVPPNVHPRTARDPRAYTNVPRIGGSRCHAPAARGPRCRSLDLSGVNLQNVCSRWLANEVGYLVNQNLTREAPPPVPSDSGEWPYFLYWCGATFGVSVNIPAARRAEFEALLLKICPAHLWLVTMVTFDQWVFGGGYTFGNTGLVFGAPGP